MADTIPTLYGGPTDRRVTVTDLQAAKARGERWPARNSSSGTPMCARS